MNGQAATRQSAPTANRSSATVSAVTLALIILLCLPSLIGAVALLLQVALHRDIAQWNETAAALIALGTLFGGPFVTIAALIGGILSFTRLRSGYKYASLCVVGAAALASLALLIKFAK